MNIQELTKLANDAYYAEKYDEAINLYQQILERSPKNKQARGQLAKAELNLSLRTATLKIPTEALQFYKRSRSFITAGDLPQARKLLKEAIAVAKKNGSKFPQAQELLDNLPNAFTADGFKQKAQEQLTLNLNQWPNALINLETAANLDRTDEANKLLLSHLQSLIKAQSLVSQLNAGIKNREKRIATITEIQKIIDATNELPVLSPLWQEVVRLFGEYDNKEKQRDTFIRNAIWSSLGAIFILIGSLWLLYIFPHTETFVDCLTVDGLEVKAKYPNYVANGDKGTITLAIENTGSNTIDGQILLNSSGTSKVKFENTDANKIKIESLVPGEQKLAKIEFSLDEPFSVISDPSHYIEFNLTIDGNGSSCTSDDFHIAISPIYGVSKVVAGLWSLVGLTLFGLFKDRIISFLFHRN